MVVGFLFAFDRCLITHALFDTFLARRKYRTHTNQEVVMSGETHVLCSVHFEPEVDDFLREQASNLGITRTDLIRRYVLEGAKAELEAALAAPPASLLSQSLSTGVLRAARAAKIIPMMGRDPDARQPSPSLGSNATEKRKITHQPLPR